MYAQRRIRASDAAGWITIPFVAIHLLDGFWKSDLLRGVALNYWLYDFAKWIVLPCVLLSWAHRFAGLSSRDYGLTADLGARDILMLLPLPLITLFLAFFFTVMLAQPWFDWRTSKFDHTVALANLRQLWIVGTFYFSATAGLWESIFCLGLPWLWFSQGRDVSRSAAIGFALVSATLFGLGHWENGAPNAIGTFVFQLVAVRWYLRFRTLWPIIGAHFLIDVYFFWPPAKI